MDGAVFFRPRKQPAAPRRFLMADCAASNSPGCAAHVACRSLVSINTTQLTSQQSLFLLGCAPLQKRMDRPREGVSLVNGHVKAGTKCGGRDMLGSVVIAISVRKVCGRALPKIHELIGGLPIYLQCASARHQTVDGRLNLRAHLVQTITVCASEVDEDSGDDVIPYTRGPSVSVQCKEMQYLILCTGAIFQGEGAGGQRHRVREKWSPKTALRRMGVDPPSLSREIALGKRGCWHAPSHQTMPLVRLCVYAVWRPSPRGGRLALTRRLRVPQEDRRPPQCEIRVPTSDYALPPPESKAEHSDPQRPRRHWRSRCSVSALQQ
ncbi:hypothetical protein TCDM_08363 [Trypanosoma cruzi Dm28c]|uniref:Uncharacterized protein n=1 Tax=Trypanosoma cruzi Dm28c TaxID=1416333 RepID=V5BH04_TRYCR|nr:hypothetical protein TCDM_08363 [Trypanosoma cruzi Dm28c]